MMVHCLQLRTGDTSYLRWRIISRELQCKFQFVKTFCPGCIIRCGSLFHLTLIFYVQLTSLVSNQRRAFIAVVRGMRCIIPLYCWRVSTDIQPTSVKIDPQFCFILKKNTVVEFKDGNIQLTPSGVTRASKHRHVLTQSGRQSSGTAFQSSGDLFTVALTRQQKPTIWILSL